MKKIFITGATGFVGSEILKLIASENYEIFALVRDESKLLKNEKIIPVKGDVLKPETYGDCLKGCDILINLIGIIREFPKKNITFENLHVKSVENLINVVKNSDLKRVIHMSANGAREDAVALYHKTKFKGEQIVINSGLNYTIFRPSVIYGPNDEFINMLADLLDKAPVFSYFGKGDQLMQPISVEEVAEAFVKSIENKETYNGVFQLCGNRVYEYKEILNLILKIKSKRKLLLPVPVFFAKLLSSLFERFEHFPLTTDQLTMLLEGNTCSERSIFEILQIKEVDMEDKLKEYLK